MESNQDKKAESLVLCEASLIEDMKLAVDAEMLPTQFTISDIKKWMAEDQIQRPDGTLYPEITTELLYNYARHTPITKKRKQKVLYVNSTSSLFSFNPF
ncbi:MULTISPECIES: hypothetical protein [Pelosinus]|jgi:hypothetical protein|uniref:Uncharacterized protein n=1 Tax=Pelosinus fermentans B4 TaxID=1149862 RepID=I8RH00_9FIRM|nr:MULTISPECIES: hypothetical protein [Pelosinus]EIW17115.1 hypothetical protein FB4_4471 [Pelosinus fermentans B4]EIW23086.1 hypothetical protein FA11_4527 [Pelosinus fermentans A11]OAM93872.1 hypothetical protein FR7_01889 [Pelosinus fermentans DSM 17108]SDQ93013.1 hypothetical protein SAMN04515679_1974 [Pelosinus fermentans]